MKKAVQKEIAGALQDCRVLEGGRTALFFKIGERVQRIATKCDHTRSDESGVSVLDAINAIRPGLLAAAKQAEVTPPPASQVYWYSAAAAVRQFSAKQRETLIKSNTPWTQIVHLLASDDIQKWIRKAEKGEKIKVRRRVKPAIEEDPEGTIQFARPLDAEKVETIFRVIFADIATHRADLSVDEVERIFGLVRLHYARRA